MCSADVLVPVDQTKQGNKFFSLVASDEFQALAQERLGGYRLHVEQAREEIEALQVRTRIYSVFDVFKEGRAGKKAVSLIVSSNRVDAIN